MGREALRQGWDVLRLATRVEVARLWSAEEIVCARQMVADPRLAEAVRHAREYGIGEYLAAAPQLLAEWRDAWAPGTHPRAAAMILAAVDARRSGMHRPLPLATLRQLHEPYLRRRGGARLRPEDFEAAMDWATTPLFATSSLLIPAEGGYLAFDYLIDSVGRDRPPPEALDALTGVATPTEALGIGDVAWGWSLTSQADTAFRRAEEGGLFEVTERRCFLVGEVHGATAALQFADEAAKRTAAGLGDDHRQVLQAGSLAAWQTGFNDIPSAAIRLYHGLAAHAELALGPEHEQTLRARTDIAKMTWAQGDQADAARQYEELAADCSRILGDDHKLAISCRELSAVSMAEAGKVRQALEAVLTLLTAITAQSGICQVK